MSHECTIETLKKKADASPIVSALVFGEDSVNEESDIEDTGASVEHEEEVGHLDGLLN
jgi:hypothetical protein